VNYKITYIHHNSFVLEAGERVFLFDYPGPNHAMRGAREAMERAIAGREIFVFNSHSHDDHFHPGIRELVAPAAKVRFVLSDDILDMYPEAVPKGSLIVEPDESYEFMGLGIDTIMSNDLGVAFLIHMDGRTIYYGGDLANWNWDADPVAQRKFTERFFASALARICAYEVDVGFSNADKRLRSQSGAADFVHVVKPAVFVPMHTFGHAEWVDALREPAEKNGSRLFAYDKPGDSATFSI
jgi:hypothetical protein